MASFKIAGSPKGHQEGKATAGSPQKAMETPKSKSGPAHLPAHSLRRQAAIEMLTAGRVATKQPVMQSHQMRVAPTATALKR